MTGRRAAALAGAVLLAGVAASAVVPRSRDDRPSRTELERDAQLYRDSAGRQCGLDPSGLVDPRVENGQITWTSLGDGRRVGFTFTGRAGHLFCGAGG